MNITIAIDGPAGCGKSTVAKRLSEILGILYLDTGSMYRAAAYWAIKNDINIDGNNPEFINMLDSLEIDIKYIDKAPNIFVNGENVTSFLRSKEVAGGASQVAKIPQVRTKMVAIQQEFAKNNSVIMDGRDIGTKVLPFSKHKFFLTASIEQRSKRRYLEEKHTGITLDEITADITKRDLADRTRKISPLIKASDAMEIDTSDLTVDRVVSIILEQVQKDVL